MGNLIKPVAFFFLLAMFFSCKNSKTMGSGETEDGKNVSQLEILNHQGVCVAQDVMLCLYSRDNGMDEWDFHYGLIKGFEYDWGYDYIIEVEPLEENAGMADDAGGDLKYLRTIKKARVDPSFTFELLLKDQNTDVLRKEGEHKYTLLDQINVNTEQLDPAKLVRLASHEGRALGVFKHSDMKANEISLTEINFN